MIMKKSFGTKTFMFPQPVLIIGTYDENGNPDAMNAAWGTQIGEHEVALHIIEHKTTDNIIKKQCFTLAIADAGHVVESDYVGIVSAKKVPDKVKRAGLTVSHADKIDAPVFDDYLLTMECKVVSVSEDFGSYRIVGEVVETHVDKRIIGDNGRVDVEKLRPIMFDGCNFRYHEIGKCVGKCFSDGNKLIKK